METSTERHSLVTLGTGESGAEFSECMSYRYALWRVWGHEFHYAMFIGLNPSTADHEQDDPTIRRCIGYAKDWGYDGVYMLNLFAFRATDPKDMKTADDPIGPLNDFRLREYHDNMPLTVAAWGTHGAYLNRGKSVLEMLDNTIHALRQTKEGHPSHPLYLPKTLRPRPMRRRAGVWVLGEPLDFDSEDPTP